MKKYLVLLVVFVSESGFAQVVSFEPVVLPRLRLSLSREVGQIRTARVSLPKEVEALASEEFVRRFGQCGMFTFAERNGNYWTFSTNIGYGGVPGPDMVVVFPRSTGLNQGTEPTIPFATPPAPPESRRP